MHPEDVSLPPLKASDHVKIAIQGFLLNTLNPAVMAFWLTAATAIAITHTRPGTCYNFCNSIAFKYERRRGKGDACRQAPLKAYYKKY